MGGRVLRTKLCDMLGVEYPVMLASMGTAGGYTLSAAVSNAGELGFKGNYTCLMCVTSCNC